MPVMDTNDRAKLLSEAEQLSKQLKGLSAAIQSLANEEQRLAELQEMFECSDVKILPIEIAGYGLDVTREMAIQLLGEAYVRKGTELQLLVNKYSGILNGES